MNSLARKFEKYILESYELETLDNADSIDVSLNEGRIGGLYSCVLCVYYRGLYNL